MNNTRKLLAFVLAGGEGTRLRPLTLRMCKPALPFGARHRIVDFVLSNLVHSGIDSIVVLTQYQSRALTDHVERAWRSRATTLGPHRRGAAGAYAGTADAVAQNLELIERLRPDIVAVFGADHIYRMDVGQMVDFHVEGRADATVATIPVPREQSRSFGIVEVDGASCITRFKEKPADAQGLPHLRTHALASMGNYLFDADVLRSVLRRAREDGLTDFGGDVLPRMIASHRLLAYDFATNTIAGRHALEEAAYWRDVGTLDAYFEAQLDTLGPLPRFRIENPAWPILHDAGPAEPPRVRSAVLHCSAVAPGCAVGAAVVERSVLQAGVRVGDGAFVEQSIVMGQASVGRGARLRRTIVEGGCSIPPGEAIGFDLERDRERYTVSDGGIVIVTRERLAEARRPAAAALVPAVA